MMLQQDQPDDYVIATGETHTVREFVQLAAQVAGFDLEFEGEGEHEVARDRASGKVIVSIDPTFYRPAEVDIMVGDASKAKRKLGWEPKVKFAGLVEILMRADLETPERN